LSDKKLDLYYFSLIFVPLKLNNKKMKKLILVFAFVSMIGLVACGSGSDANVEEPEATEVEETTPEVEEPVEEVIIEEETTEETTTEEGVETEVEVIEE
jgi:hypothetical protein